MTYKKVVAFGDSFTRGDELADCPPQLFQGNPFAHSTRTWPALLAHQLGIDYDCRAMGGRGNQYISNQVNRHINSADNYLFIVNWTYFGRFDFLDHDDLWSTICPGYIEHKFETDYYKIFDNDIWNLNRNLQIIHSVLSLLREYKIDFIFTCHDSTFKATFDNLRTYKSELQNHWQKSIDVLSKSVVPTITEFEGVTFREWAAKHDYPVGPGGHPLEKAHIEAAKYINTNVIEGKNYGH